MSTLGCKASIKQMLEVSDDDIEVIESTLAERTAAGVPLRDAQRQAVAEARAQLALERQRVEAAIAQQIPEGLTAPTKAEVVEQQDRAANAPALDAKEQIDREASAQTLTTQTAPEQRKDTTGDLLGGPSAEEVLAAKKAAEAAKAKPKGGPDLFDAPKAAAPDKIEDFGEKLPPARRAMSAKLSEELSDDDIATKPFSEIWPLAENEDIEDTFAAAVAVAARAEVPAKPRVAYKLKRWVEAVKTVRSLAAHVLSGRLTRARLMEEVKGPRASLKDWAAKVLLLEQIPREQWKRIGAVQERPDAFTYAEGKQVPTPSLRLEVDGKPNYLRNDGMVSGNMDEIRALLGTAAPEKRMEFEIRGPKGGPYKINKKGDSQYRRLMEFATFAEARAAIADDYAGLVAAWESVKDRDNITERDLRSAENRPRAGKDWRDGKDVTPEQFRDTFGFRGGEFGKWVAQGKGDKERQALLNSAYDALMDLSAIVGIPPKAISLDGTLGIAFGSRGAGWASAHFEPSNLVINLTKTRGAGALAHEWFHALDNYFSRQRGGEKLFTGDQKKYRAENYITHKPEPLMVRKDGARYFGALTAGRLEALREANPTAVQYAADKWHPDPKHPAGVRPEVEQRFADLVRMLDESPMTKRAQTLDKSGSGYWSSTLERAARTFENYVQARMMEDGYHNDFLANVVPVEDTGRNPERYPYLLPGEVKPIAEAFGALFDTIQTRDTDTGGVAMFSRDPSFKMSDSAQQLANRLAAMGSPTGMSRGDFSAAMARAFGLGASRALLKSGVVTPIEDQSQLPQHVVPYVRSGDIVYGFYDPNSDRTYAVLQNLSPAMVKGLVLHEVGVHFGFEQLLGKQKYLEVIGRIKAMGQAGNEQVLKALASAQKNSVNAAQVPEETLAYLVQNNPEMGIVKRVIAAIKAFLFEKFGIGGRMLSVDDITQLAYAAVAHSSRATPGKRRTDFAGTGSMSREKVVPLNATSAEQRLAAMGYKVDRNYEDDPAFIEDADGNEFVWDDEAKAFLTEDGDALPQEAADIAQYIGNAIDGIEDFEQAAGAANDRNVDPFSPTSGKPRERTGKGAESALEAMRKQEQEKPSFSRHTAVQGAIDQINTLAKDVPGKLSWWHKSVGTMQNLALRSPNFKRVYDSVQHFLSDVSYFASEAADLAPTILPKLETWGDIAKTPISPEDNRAIQAPVFEGTLKWKRGADGKPVEEADPHKAGIVWTDAELKGKFTLSGKQIGLYRETRAAIDRSLSDLAKSDMIRFAGKDVVPIAEVVMQSKTLKEAAETVALYVESLVDLDPARAAVLKDTAAKVRAKGERAQDLIDRGYAPLSRFGSYTLEATLPDGEKYFGMFESNADRQKMARTLTAAQATGLVQGTMSQEAYKIFSGVSPETLELFGDMIGLESQEGGPGANAFQEYLKLARSNRSAMKRLIERKGIAGFREDVGRVLAGFVYSNARQVSSNLHMGEMSQSLVALKESDKTQGELLDAAVKLVEYVKNPQEEAQAIRGLLFAQYIGGSVASAMVNLTQPITMTLPWLSQYGGLAKAGKQLARAANDAGKGVTGDAKFDAAMKRAEEEGIVSPQEVHQLMAQAQGRGALKAGDGTTMGNATAKAGNALSKLAVAWGKGFSLAEQFNRRVTFIAAYRTAVERGEGDPYEFATDAINQTQGVYNKGNKPQWARGAVGSTIFTFKQYGINYVEMLQRMATKNGPEGKRAALYALGILFLLSGVGGAPGADDLDDVVSGGMQALGYNFDAKARRREFFADLFGKAGADFMERGVSGITGVPIDVSGRLGLGNLIPGTGLLTKKTDHSRDVAEIAGVAGDFGARVFQAGGKLVSGDLTGAATEIAPKAIQNLAQAHDMATMGMYRDKQGRKVIDTDGYDAFAKAIGFQPNDVKRVQDAAIEVQRRVSLNKIREDEIADKWAQGLFEDNPAKVEAARTAMADWNTDNPESPIRVNFSQIRRRVAAMKEDRATRVAKTAPPEIRAAVRAELGVR